MDVTVAVATFGDESWAGLALERAIPSVPDGVRAIHVHSDTLHGARNLALDCVSTEWIIFLDADDELGSFYVDRMDEVEADVRIPLVSYVTPQKAARPRFMRVAGHTHDCEPECLDRGNYIVIGAAVRAQLIRDIGGWRDFDCYEDWDLWLRCFQARATFERTRAVYRAHARPDSRNRGTDRAVKHATHQAIARANGVPVPA